MVPGYPSTVSRQSRERSSWETQEFHEETLLKIWNSNQESTIPKLERSSKHCKKTKEKKVEKKLEFRTSSN